MRRMRSVAITAAVIMWCLTASSKVFAVTVIQYTASGTFSSTPSCPQGQLKCDGLRLAGEPFSISAFVSEAKTPTKSGTAANGAVYATYAPLDLTGTVQSGDLPTPTTINAYASIILTKQVTGRDEFQLYAPIKISGTVNIHGIILLPPGTLSTVGIGLVPSTYAIPAGSSLTYTTSTGTTTLGLDLGSVLSGTVYTGAAVKAHALLNANGIQVITAHPDGTQSIRPLAGAPVDLGISSDKVMLRFYASGVDASDIHMQLAGQDAPVLYAGPAGHFAGLDEVLVEVPQSLAGTGEVDAILTTGTQTADPVRVRIQ